MDINKLVKKGIKRFIETIRGEYVIDKEKDRNEYLRSIKELESIHKDKGRIENLGRIKVYRMDEEGSFRFYIDMFGLYEDKNRIAEKFGEKTILKKDSSRNFESLLSSTKERMGKIKISVNGDLYNKNPRKFAREFYRMIENQPTGFETEKEPSIFEYIEPYLYFTDRRPFCVVAYGYTKTLKKIKDLMR